MKVTSITFVIAAITNSAQASGVARMTKVAKAELRSKTTGQKANSVILSKTPKAGAKAARISKATKGTGTIAKASKTTAKASKIGQKAEKKKIGQKVEKKKIGKASKGKGSVQPSDPIDPVNPPETEVPTSKPTEEDNVPSGPGTPKTSLPTKFPADEPSPQPSNGNGCGGPACPTSNPTLSTPLPTIAITPFPTLTPIEPCPPGEESTSSLPSMEPSIRSSSSPSESSSSSSPSINVTEEATRSPVTMTSAPSDALSLEPTLFVSPEPTLAVASPEPTTNTPTVQTGGDTLEPTLLETNIPTGGVNEEDGSTLLDTLMPTSSFDNIPLTPTFYPTTAPSCTEEEEEQSAAMDVPSAKPTSKPTSIGWIAAPLPPIIPFPSESPIVVTDDPTLLSANLLLEDTPATEVDKVDAKDTSEVVPGTPRMSMPTKASKISKAHLRNMSMSISSSLSMSAHGRALSTSKTGKGVKGKGNKTTTPFAKTHKKEKQASIEDVEIAHSILIDTGVVTKPKSDKSATNEDVNLLQVREKPFRHAKMAKYAK